MAPSLLKNWLKHLLKPRQFSQKGFTLLELLVAIVISGIVTSGLLFLVIELMSINNREESLTQTQQSMRRAIDYITRDVSEAAFVYSDFTNTYRLLDQLDDEPANASPVLAFWRLDPLTNQQVADLNTYCAAQAANSAAAKECGALLVRQSTYTLVVYFQQNNPANSIWEGQSRIIRYELPAYTTISTSALTRNSGYADPTLLVPGVTPPVFNSFNSWRKAATGTTRGRSEVLTDYVNVKNDNVTSACPTLPGGATFARTPTTSDSFYTCVAQPDGDANTQETNKSVIVYLQGNASKGPANQVVGTSASSSLPKLESQVLIRGQIQ